MDQWITISSQMTGFLLIFCLAENIQMSNYISATVTKMNYPPIFCFALLSQIGLGLFTGIFSLIYKELLDYGGQINSFCCLIEFRIFTK